jgi:hypothetical protein
MYNKEKRAVEITVFSFNETTCHSLFTGAYFCTPALSPGGEQEAGQVLIIATVFYEKH